MSKRLVQLALVLWLVAAMPLTALADPTFGGLTALAVAAFWSAIAGAAVTLGVSVGLSLIGSALTGRSRSTPPVGATLQTIRLTTARLGEGLPRIYGKAGVGGKVIHRGYPVRRTTIGVPVGQGKRRTTSTATVYSASWGLAVCPNPEGSILGVTRIWFDDKIAFTLNSAAIATLDGTTQQQMIAAGAVGSPYILGYQGGPWSVAGSASRFKICLGEETQAISDDGGADGNWLPDWYVNNVGSTNTPGYRGVVTIWWDDMDLTQWYNRLPSVIVEVLSADNTVDLIFTRECKLAGLTSGQYSTSGFGTTNVAGMVVDSPRSGKEVLENLAIAYPFGVAEIDGAITLRQLDDDSNGTVTAAELAATAGGIEDISPDPDARQKTPRFSATFANSVHLPRRVEITHLDGDDIYNKRYQQASHGYSRQSGVQQGVRQVFVPLVLTGAEAVKVAQQALSTIYDEKFGVKVVLPPKYLAYAPGDRLTIPGPDGSSSVVVRISTINFAPGEPLEVEGVRVGQLIVEGATPGSGGGLIGGAPAPDVDDDTDTDKPVIDTVLFISNVPPLLDEWDNTDGLTVAITPKVANNAVQRPWTGATVYRNATGSDDTYQVYEIQARLSEPAVIGVALTDLLTGTGTLSYSGADAATYVDIEFPYGFAPDMTAYHLGSGGDADAFTKTTTTNLCILNKEVFQFRDVEDVSASYPSADGPVYRLKHLKRGIRDTEGFVNDHAIGDPFLLWERQSVVRVFVNQNEAGGNVWNWKCASIGEVADDVNPVAVTFDPDAGNTYLHDTP